MCLISTADQLCSFKLIFWASFLKGKFASGECSLENMRTLCVACHSDVTVAQCAERRLIRMKAKKQLKVIMNCLKDGEKMKQTNSNSEVKNFYPWFMFNPLPNIILSGRVVVTISLGIVILWYFWNLSSCNSICLLWNCHWITWIVRKLIEEVRLNQYWWGTQNCSAGVIMPVDLK